MLSIRWKAFLLIVAVSIICLFIWLISGLIPALIVFSASLLLYLVRHLYWLSILHRWLRNPSLQSVPEGSGVWENVYSSLLRYERNNHAKQSELNSALDRFNITANAIPDGLVILNNSNEIEWCTRHAEYQLGLDLSIDKNRPIVNLVRNSNFIAYLYNENYHEPLRLEHRRNSEAVLELTLIPLANKDKLLISRDITQMEKVDAMRRDFIANVSHELRTPLTVVGGFIETLSDMEGAIPDSIRNYFNMMQEQTTRMRRLIEDLLTLSKIESNTQPPDDRPINMSALINMMLNDANALSQGKHQISTEITPNLDIIGAIDELQSALSNLVSNAVRYTHQGGKIEIIWQLRDNLPVFSVRDNGIGIAQQHIDRLTERFYRVDRGRSRETGGTGLGLAIVKHILTRHQAKLEIISEPGVGSTFSAVFPSKRTAHR